jgi:hypothetical protein
MIITRNNYEPFVIDYLDGALSHEMTAELLLFLELNPDIATEVDGLNNEPIFSEAPLLFEQKDSLRKSEIPEHADELMFLVTEGLASSDQKSELDSLLVSNPSLEKEFRAMQKARWTAEPIVFENKTSLYKSEESASLTGDMRLAALLEGDLNAKESARLHSEIKADRTLASSWSAMQKTKLSPVVIPFEAKDSLYRKQARVITLRRALYFAAAACALFFVALFWNSENVMSPVASNNSHETPTIKTPETHGQTAPTPNSEPQKEELILTDPSLAFTPKSSDNKGTQEVSPKKNNVNPEIQTPDPNEGYADNSVKTNRLNSKNPGIIKTSRATGEIIPTKAAVAELPLPENTAQATTPTETFPTILQFVGEKAREKILGDEPLEEATAYALVEKGLNKISGQENAKIERKNRGFRFKLGKFEVERN